MFSDVEMPLASSAPTDLIFSCSAPTPDGLIEHDITDCGAEIVNKALFYGELCPPRWLTADGAHIYSNEDQRAIILRQHLLELSLTGLPMGNFSDYWGSIQRIPTDMWEDGDSEPAILFRYEGKRGGEIFFNSLESFKEALYQTSLFSETCLVRLRAAVARAAEAGVLDPQGYISPTNADMPMRFINVRCMPEEIRRVVYGQDERFVDERWIALVNGMLYGATMEMVF